MIILFGIKNCDTVKKARLWLSEHNVEHRFHDVRTDGLKFEEIEEWIAKTDWEIILNRRGTTWRKLDPSTQENVTRSNIAELLLANPAMIKRPYWMLTALLALVLSPISIIQYLIKSNKIKSNLMSSLYSFGIGIGTKNRRGEWLEVFTPPRC